MTKRNGKIIACAHCGTGVYKPLGRIERAKNNFCSSKCFDLFRINRIKRSCQVCKKVLFRVPSKATGKERYVVCSRKCWTVAVTGKNLSGFFKKGNRKEKCINYKNGTQVTNGYISELVPEHPAANKRGYVYQHRLVMEKHIGRYLGRKEVVHHKNFDKKDNRIENLMLFATDGDHRRHHQSLKLCKA